MISQVGHSLIKSVAALLGVEAPNAAGEPPQEESPMKEESPEVGQKRIPLTSGDDLGGDFEGLGVDEEPALGTRKKKKMRKLQ